MDHPQRDCDRGTDGAGADEREEMKSIIVRRNDTGETATIQGVTCLETNSPDGFPVKWIEDDESSRLADVNIDSNGTYTAAELGVYGIRKAHVAVRFTDPVTVGGITYQIYVDTTGRPHIKVSRDIP